MLAEIELRRIYLKRYIVNPCLGRVPSHLCALDGAEIKVGDEGDLLPAAAGLLDLCDWSPAKLQRYSVLRTTVKFPSIKNIQYVVTTFLYCIVAGDFWV